MDANEENKLAKERIPKLLWSLAIPAICAQLITLFYNLIDRIFIGRMENGIMAMGAIGICAPVVTVVSAFCGLFGQGGAPLAAISMGKGDKEEEEEYLGNSFWMLVVSSAVIMAVVLIFQTPLLTLFGASENTLPYAKQYITVYCLGTVFIQLTVGMNYYITTQGFAKTAMITTMLGGVLNMLLDPVFIFALHMGVRGAALATVISQFISFLWVMRFLFGKKTSLRLHPGTIRLSAPRLKEIMVLGSAPFFMNISEGVLNICFNNQALRFGGDIAVGAMTILFSIFQFMLLPVEGVAQGSQPIIGYNYGAGKFDRVRETVKLSVISTLTFTMCATAAVMLAPGFFIGIFNSNPELVLLGKNMLRIYIGGMFVLGLNSTCQETYNSLGEGKKAFFFAFYRKVILLIPLLYILPHALPAWGVMAVMLAEPIADIVTTATNAVHFRYFLKKKVPV
ncbi:MAG: MATE family efflux transporter [Clostridium sp.]|nr:MATE family efflux transporter [Clostridium sp.]